MKASEYVPGLVVALTPASDPDSLDAVPVTVVTKRYGAVEVILPNGDRDSVRTERVARTWEGHLRRIERERRRRGFADIAETPAEVKSRVRNLIHARLGSKAASRLRIFDGYAAVPVGDLDDPVPLSALATMQGVGPIGTAEARDRLRREVGLYFGPEIAKGADFVGDRLSLPVRDLYALLGIE